MENKSRKTKYVATMLIGMFISSNATASDVFAMFDWNSDGVLSGNEAELFVAFDTSPVNQPDGEISKSEFLAGLKLYEEKRADHVAKIFAARNGNKDDRLSGTELSGYEFADMDGNGRISSDELLDGFSRQRARLATLSHDEVVSEGMRRFNALDINEDGRLSGSEASGLQTLDLNQDRKILLSEFMASIFLDAAFDPDAPESPTDAPAGRVMRSVVDAVNRRDADAIVGMFHPELEELVDEVIVDYLLYHIIESHGALSAPANDSVEIKDSAQPGQVLHSAKLICEKGNLSIHLTLLEDVLVGFDFDSPQIVELNDTMFADLLADKNGVLTKFANFYHLSCESMIEKILSGEDAEAFGMFHPEIQNKLGMEPFTELFKGLRNGCGTDSVKVELEEAGVEFDENGKGRFFTISHRVTGPKGSLLFSNKLQFVGLKAYFVAAGTEPIQAEDEPVLAPPVPLSDDDDPLPPPAPRKNTP